MDNPTKAKRGPKHKVTPNPNAHLICMAVDDGMPFIDDAVMAGLYIAVGDSGGKLNVRPRHLRKVICLDTISTVEVLPRFLNNQAEPICDCTARYLVAAARIALGGIERHLNRNPLLKARLQALWDKQQRIDGVWDSTVDCSSLAGWEWQERYGA